MEAESRSDTSSLALGASSSFRKQEFFQLVFALLQKHPNAVKPGFKGPFSAELIRFRSHASLGFPASDIESLSLSGKTSTDYELVANLMGLYGPSSPLPVHYTEALLDEVDELNTPRQFLDLFNHRLLSLFYRAWDKYRIENHYRPDVSDQYSRHLLSLMGFGQITQDKDGAIEWNRLLPMARVLSGRNRSVTSIEKTLGHYFDVPCKLESFVSERVSLDATQQTCLGAHACRLGEETVVGRSILSSSTRFRIHIGPVDYVTYLRFLPGKQWHAALRQLIEKLVTDSHAYEVWIKVNTGQVPPGRLSRDMPVRLGWTAWLGRSKGQHIVIKQAGNC